MKAQALAPIYMSLVNGFRLAFSTPPIFHSPLAKKNHLPSSEWRSLEFKLLKESRMNLKILTRIEYEDKIKRTDLLDEIEQLIKIIATIIKNKS